SISGSTFKDKEVFNLPICTFSVPRKNSTSTRASRNVKSLELQELYLICQLKYYLIAK
ncbi:15433_t:CDS:1, partial [Gigaspora rosea]